MTKVPVSIRWLRSLFLACLLLASIPVLALNPERQIAEYAHQSWKVRDGALPGRPLALAQTNDGFLWVGTLNGLLRFDGVQFTDWSSRGDWSLPSPSVESLLGARDGSLWIGTEKGVSHLEQGHSINFLEESEADIHPLAEDAAGNLWLWRSGTAKQPLCRITGNTPKCFGEEAGVSVAAPIDALLVDKDDTLWMGSATSLLRWTGSKTDLRPLQGLESNTNAGGVLALIREAPGSILMGIGKSGPGLGLERLVDGKLTPVTAPGFDGSTVDVNCLLLDKQHALWIGSSDGLYRLYNGQIDRFSMKDGLSGLQVWAIMEDHEGSVWIATSGGLDNFHDTRVVSIASRPNFHSVEVDGVFATHDGSLWVSGFETLSVLGNGAAGFVAPAGPLSNLQITTIFEDHRGAMWVGAADQLNIFKDGHLGPISMEGGGPVGMIVSMTEDQSRNLWAVSLGPPRSVLRIDPIHRTATAVAGLPPASRVASDAVGGIWLGLLDGDIARYRDGQLDTFHAQHPGLTSRIKQLTAQPDGSVLAATTFGLVGWKDGRIAVLSRRNGLPCNELYATIFDSQGDLWLYMQCGLVRISPVELRSWWHDSTYRVQFKVFDSLDGAQGGLTPFGAAARTPDGRLWFANGDLLQMMDPVLANRNRSPPPVYVESLVADGLSLTPSGKVVVPPRTHDLQIDYTAPTFISPQKVLFRYKLEGFDRVWSEAGARRQAFYTQLPPGNYRFRVSVSNSDGVWNPTGASLDFAVAPAYYQRLGFRILCASGGIALIWLLFRMRVHAVTERIRLREAARSSERERIARQIHDTFLQSVQAFMQRFSGVADEVAKDHPTRPLFHELVQLSDGVIAEVRSGIHGLREAPEPRGDLSEALAALGQALSTYKPIQFSVTTAGKVRGLTADSYELVYAIAREAMRNAATHSEGKSVTVELEYSSATLRLSVRDDGRGMDEHILRHGREGHWGLLGMQERADALQAKLTVSSRLGAGTELKLTIPAEIAFASPPRTWFTRKPG